MKLYSPLHPAAFFMIQRRMRRVRRILAERYSAGVEDIRFLEVGCGNGQWLAEFQAFGLRSRRMAGIELDPERAKVAAERIPGADIRAGDAVSLPWPDASFDIVFQSTVFTSVASSETRRRIAGEMKRVCARDGIVLWYDFVYNNPANPNVHGIPVREVRDLFAPWTLRFYRTTLAPPLARRIVPFCWLAAEIIESAMPFFCTHVLAEIRAPE